MIDRKALHAARAAYVPRRLQETVASSVGEAELAVRRGPRSAFRARHICAFITWQKLLPDRDRYRPDPEMYTARAVFITERVLEDYRERAPAVTFTPEQHRAALRRT